MACAVGNNSFMPLTVAPRAQLGLTILYITLYALLFVIVLVQLWMIYCYRHRLFSLQTAFLFLSLLWSALRVELFSFYFTSFDPASHMPLFWYWLLYCCPVFIQFVTLCLLVIFFSQVIFRLNVDHRSRQTRCGLMMTFIGFAILIFLITNIWCAVLVHNCMSSPDCCSARTVQIVRVAVDDSLFLILGAILSVFIYRVSQVSTVSVILEAKGTTKCQAIAASTLIILLYTSRAVYNFFAIIDTHLLSFGYDWINVTNQADNSENFTLKKSSYAYISFGIVLFVWEFLPTLAVVLFYRVRVPRVAMDPGIMGDISTGRGDIFSNPHRYDSDDELERNLSLNNRLWPSPRGSFSQPVNSPGRGSFIERASFTPPSAAVAGIAAVNYGTFPTGASPVVRGGGSGTVASSWQRRVQSSRPGTLTGNLVSPAEHYYDGT